MLPLSDPPRPEKSCFSVAVQVGEADTPEVVAKTGPEPRPFPDLVALDTAALAARISDMLSA